MSESGEERANSTPNVLSNVVVPVASEDDATSTARSLAPYLSRDASVTVVYVVEKAGGSIDKAPVAQREDEAAAAFEQFRANLGDHVVESEILYDTDVTDAVFEAADTIGASAVVISPRGGSRWVQLLTGDVALEMITENDRPVVVLPDVEPSH